jgi:hypothetical protein
VIEFVDTETQPYSPNLKLTETKYSKCKRLQRVYGDMQWIRLSYIGYKRCDPNRHDST